MNGLDPDAKRDVRETRRGARGLALARAWGRVAGPVAFRRALPTYATLAMAAAVLFVGGNAMPPAELTSVISSSWKAHAACLAMWCLVSWPVARALLLTPQLGFLRLFAVPWTTATVIAGGWLLVAQLPWVALWIAGGGALEGLRAGLCASAVHALVAASLVGARRRGTNAAALLGLALVASGLGERNPLGGSLLVLPALAFALRRVWCEGEEMAPRPRREVGGGTGSRSAAFAGLPLLAWSQALGRSLRRTHAAVLVRWLWWSLIVTLGAVLATKSNGLQSNGLLAESQAPQLLIALLSGGALIGAAGGAAALARSERVAAWWLDALGLSSLRRMFAQGFALLPWSLALACAQCALWSWLVGFGGPSFRLIVGAAATALMGTCGAVVLRAASEQGDGRDGGRWMAWLIGGAGLQTFAAWRSREGGLFVATALLVTAARLASTERGRRAHVATAGQGEA